MTLSGRHKWYHPVRDLPSVGVPGSIRLGIDFLAGELFEEWDDELDLEALARAVGDEQLRGGALQAKVDGCWAALTIGDGVVDAVTSRSNHPLRQGQPWLGADVSPLLRGWTVLGELEAGTTRAHLARMARGELDGNGRSLVAPRLHVYGVRDPAGCDRLAELPELPLPPRWVPVEECDGGWYEWTRDLLEGGGEGVVIKRDDGWWRAKAEAEAERVICGDRVKSDRNGQPRRSLCLGAYVGRRVERLQWVVCPDWWALSPRRTHRAVVTVRHWGESEAGVLRHGAITGIRDDKRPTEVLLD